MNSVAQRAGEPVRLSDDHFYLTLLAALGAIVWGVSAALALVLHRNFLTIACDTAVLQSGIVNTLHGHWFANNGAGGPNILGSHTTFILLALIPIYVVAPYPETLFLLQIAGVYSVIFPLYLVARELGQKPLAAFFIAGFAPASAFLTHMAMAPFHLETWIAAATLWSYYFYLRGKLAGFLASLVIAVCCGEQAALIYIALGASLLLFEDGCAWRARFGRASLISGLLWIVLAVGIISPLASENHPFNIFAYNYKQWGVTSAAGLPSALMHHPGRALGEIFNLDRWGHIMSVLGVLGVTAFLSWRSLVLLAPLPAYLLMSDQEFSLYFHAYYYTFIFFAGYIGLLRFLQRRDPGDRVAVAFLAMLALGGLITVCGATGYYFQLAGGVDEPFSTTLRQEFARIPANATVYGPHRYSVYLSNRENLVIGDLRAENLDFDAMLNAEFDQTNVRPGQVDYIVSDFLTDQCGWRDGYLDAAEQKARSDAINRLVAGGRWERFWEKNDVVILKRVAK
jgi:uncharacterized membrane protein